MFRTRDVAEFATAIPGGDFGVVPTDSSEGFRATIREAGLGGGVLARSVLTSGNIGVRSRFAGGPVPTITYMFSTPGSTGLVMDGKELRAGLLMARQPGQAPHLRTFQPQEIAGVLLTEDVLRRTFDAISGQEHARLLAAPATSRQPVRATAKPAPRRHAHAGRGDRPRRWPDAAGAGHIAVGYCDRRGEDPVERRYPA